MRCIGIAPIGNKISEKTEMVLAYDKANGNKRRGRPKKEMVGYNLE